MYKLISLTPIINIFKVKDTYKDRPDQAGSISMLLITSTPIDSSPPSPPSLGVREMSLYMP